MTDAIASKTDTATRATSRVVEVLRGKYILPGGECQTLDSSAQRTPSTEKAWDDIDLDALLPLKESRYINTEVGYWLRHYWVPATDLTYHLSSLTFPSGKESPIRIESDIQRELCRCQADHCIWREKSTATAYVGDGMIPLVSPFSKGSVSDRLCHYNRSYQTFRSTPVLSDRQPAPETAVDARRNALMQLPFLHPTAPVPMEGSWEGKAGEDVMKYRLVSEERVGDTAVVLVRREGRLTMSIPTIATGRVKSETAVLERKGITVFAYNRSVVLEDRIYDRFIHSSIKCNAFVGATQQSAMRLVRSSPPARDSR